MFDRRSFLLAGMTTVLAPRFNFAAEPAVAAPYRIVLRSRHAEAIPTRAKDAQTGGGSIIVEQPEPNTVVVTMGGSVVAGSAFHQSHASLAFELTQDLEIVPTRAGLRPPRLGLIGRVIGTLQVTDPGKCGKSCGTSEQGPATASLCAGDSNLLAVSVPPAALSCCQELAINHREGPVEAVAAAGGYTLSGSFRIGVTQGKGVWHRQAAVADFDPAPQLDGFWADALKPFRAVPRRDFGFKIVVRVVEDAAPPAAPEK
ncbi:MAG: hypothetical protein JNM56_07375 [Planctomycetia bacterium]|nr:hypothetical protein [Planctomycetia bacterium]